MFCFRLKSWLIAHVFQLVSKDYLGCQRYDRDSGNLADVRYGTAGTRVNLNYVYVISKNDKLDVDHTDDMQCSCKTFGVLCNSLFCFFTDGSCRIYGNTVTGMDSGTLNMLHNTRNQNVLAVAYGINLDFFSHQVLVNKDWMLLCDLVDHTDVLFHILIAYCNTHSLTAKYIGRTNQNRIAQLICSFLRFLCGKYSVSLRSRDLALLKNLIKQLTVLSCIYVLSRCSKNLHTHLGKSFCQLDGSLSAELNNRSVRFLNIYNILNILRCKGLKIQLICNIKVCTYSFRIVVDNNRLIAFLRKSPGTVYGAEIELNTLSDTDRSGTKYQDLFLIRCGNCFVLCAFITIYRIVIRSCSSKLCSTGINHLICSLDAVLTAKSLDFILSFACKAGNDVVRELHAFCFQKKFFGKLSVLQCILHTYQNCNLVNEPDIDLCDIVKHGLRHTAADCFCNLPDSAVIYDLKLCKKLLVCKLGKIIRHQAVHMLLQGTDRFHKSTFKAMTDTHNLSGSFHLCGKGSLCCNKFIKRKSRDLNYTVVKHWLKACVCFACDGIWNLIQCISKGNLCSNLSNGITGSLTCKCRRTAYTWVNLDYTVLKAVWLQRILNITAACDSKLCDNIKSRCTKHLILFVTKSLRWCNYNRVSCVNTNRVNIFHIADGNTVSCTVTHYLILNFFPACDTAFYQNLSDTGKTKSILQDLAKLIFIMGNTAAASTKGISRTKYNRITDGIGKCKSILYCCNNLRCCNRLTNFFHGIFKFLTVLSLLNGLSCSSDQSYIMLLQETLFIQLHSQIQACLSAKSRKYTVRFLLQDQLLYNLYSKRFNINTVSNVFICHNGCRVGVQKNNLKAFFF